MPDPDRLAARLRAVVLVASAVLLLALAFAPQGDAQPILRRLNDLVRSSGVVAQSAQAAGTAQAEESGELPSLHNILQALKLRVEQRAPAILAELLAALLVFTFFYLLQRAAVRVLERVLHRAHADPAVSGLGIKLTRYLLLGVGLLSALQQLGVQVTSLLAGVGIAGLAVGLAAQDTIANLLGGFMLLLERPFRIGDSVTVAGTSGQVLEIGLRSTHLRTADVRDAFLPNREIISRVIVNHTLTPQLRIDLPIGVGYAADLDRVRQVLLGTLAEHPQIADEPPAQVVVTGLGDVTVSLELRFWLRSSRDETGVRFEILEKAKKALDAAGIGLPAHTRVVRVGAHKPVAIERTPSS